MQKKNKVLNKLEDAFKGFSKNIKRKLILLRKRVNKQNRSKNAIYLNNNDFFFDTD